MAPNLAELSNRLPSLPALFPSHKELKEAMHFECCTFVSYLLESLCGFSEGSIVCKAIVIYLTRASTSASVQLESYSCRKPFERTRLLVVADGRAVVDSC